MVFVNLHVDLDIAQSELVIVSLWDHSLFFQRLKMSPDIPSPAEAMTTMVSALSLAITIIVRLQHVLL